MWWKDKDCGTNGTELRQGVLHSTEFFHEHGSSIATTLWLIKPFFASGKTLFVDSWFASLRNASELMNREI